MRFKILLLLLSCTVGLFAQGTGEVIITEIHNRPQKPTDAQLAGALPNNPAGADTEPNEGHTEWFEIYNTTSADVVMDGWTLTDASSNSATTIGSFTIGANEYAVFSGFNIPAAQGGIEFDYFYDYKTPSFNNESSFSDIGDTSCPDGVIIQKADGTLVDELLYDYGYGWYIGNPGSPDCMMATETTDLPPQTSLSKISFMLNVDPAVMNAADNDLAANWSYSTIVYDPSNTQRGTPGGANDGSTPSGPAPPGSGEVIITEIYNRPLKPTEEQLAAAIPNNPPGSDAEPNEGHTEWFEVYNTTTSDIVMDGWTLTDASNNNESVIGSFTLPAESYAVFAGFDIPDAHGGVEFDYFYDYKAPSFNNESSFADPGDNSCPDGVIIRDAAGELVDEVKYDYGYGEYIGNASSPNCSNAAAPIGIPAQQSVSKVSFMLLVDPAVMNSADNNLPQNWVFSTNIYDPFNSNSQIGTPGEVNNAMTPVSTNDLPENSIRIYPNPTSTSINLISELEGNFEIEIFDIVGKRLNDVKIATNRSVDVSNLPIGIYTVKISLDGKSTAKKFAIQR